MKGTSEAREYRAAAIEPLRWRCWSGDYVVFNPFSGRTHLLDIVTGHVLMTMKSGSSSVAGIRVEVARFLEVDNDGKVAYATVDILARLESVGLIKPVS